MMNTGDGDLPELVGIAEIAERYEVVPQAVSNWVRRHDGFPAPVVRLRMGPVWKWEDVKGWVHERWGV